MTASTYNAWVRETEAECDGDTVTIYAANKYAVDWLSLRLRRVIERTLASIVKRDLTIQFAVAGATP